MVGHLEFSWKDVRPFLESEFKNTKSRIFFSTNSRFPDDKDKCDICFGIFDDDRGLRAFFWNYKNGPAYNPSKELSLDDIPKFSFGGDDLLIAEFISKIKEFTDKSN